MNAAVCTPGPVLMLEPAGVVHTALAWHRLPSARMPDTETTVLCAMADGDWHSGWWDSELGQWMEASTGGTLHGVVAWAEPEVPAC